MLGLSTTVEFQFPEPHPRKNAIFFQGSVAHLALPALGDEVKTDDPAGIVGVVRRTEIETVGGASHVMIHCEVKRKLAERSFGRQ